MSPLSSVAFGPFSDAPGPISQSHSAMHMPHISVANLTHSLVRNRAYMCAIIDPSTHVHKGRIAMNTNLNTTTMAPHSVLVSTVSDLIAPIVYVISAAVVSVFSRAKRSDKNKGVVSMASQAPYVAPHVAPHVAMVMVPGKFVTEPFSHH